LIEELSIYVYLKIIKIRYVIIIIIR
jgi:hypothetical protein